MAKNELLPFADGEDANVLPTNQWEGLTDILENGFQSGIAKSEQVNRVLAQGAVASYVLGQLIVDQLSKDATLDKNALYQNLILALQENAKDACLPLSGGNVTGNLTVQGKNLVRSVNGVVADPSGNVVLTGAYITETWKNGAGWYRKWSDGFIEQGGSLGANSDDSMTITMSTAFSNTSYYVGLSYKGLSIAPDSYKLYVYPSTTTTFKVEHKGTGFASGCWYACGY